MRVHFVFLYAGLCRKMRVQIIYQSQQEIYTDDRTSLPVSYSFQWH